MGRRGEYFVASDIPALLQPHREMFFLAAATSAVLTAKGVHVMDHEAPRRTPRAPRRWGPIMAEKGGYNHYAETQIFEQRATVRDTLAGAICGPRKSLPR